MRVEDITMRTVCALCMDEHEEMHCRGGEKVMSLVFYNVRRTWYRPIKLQRTPSVTVGIVTLDVHIFDGHSTLLE